ncbi:hypothetical protein [Guyparkeria halopsychrophila]|uniref:hypothetical protein n=1 Tax=Guyparkeria halopsychrophila TaxID=3139421 RepID=UPI0037C6D52C
MSDLNRLSLSELRGLIDAARSELDRRDSEPVDEHTLIKSLELDLKRHHRRKDQEAPFDPFA